MTHEVYEPEAAILWVARAVVGQASLARIQPLLGATVAPERIGPTAGRLLQETLARGVVLWLCTRGGAHSAEWLEPGGGVAARSRVWQRHAPPQLRFTASTTRILRWVLGMPGRPTLEAAPVALGDELVMVMAADLLAETTLYDQLLAQPLTRASGLVWLMHTEATARSGKGVPDEAQLATLLAPLLSDDGAVVLEALTPELRRRLRALFAATARIGDMATLTQVGEATANVLAALARHADKARRPDLLSCVADALVDSLDAVEMDAELAPPLPPQAALQQRMRALKAAGAWLAAARPLGRRLDGARGASFIDDDYQAQQLLLRRWEKLTPDRVAKAEALLARLQNLDAALAP